MYEARSYLDRWILEEKKKNPIHHTGMIFLHVFLQCHILSEKNFTHFQYCKIIKTDLRKKKRLLNVKVDLVIDFYIKFY